MEVYKVPLRVKVFIGALAAIVVIGALALWNLTIPGKNLGEVMLRRAAQDVVANVPLEHSQVGVTLTTQVLACATNPARFGMTAFLPRGPASSVKVMCWVPVGTAEMASYLNHRQLSRVKSLPLDQMRDYMKAKDKFHIIIWADNGEVAWRSSEDFQINSSWWGWGH